MKYIKKMMAAMLVAVMALALGSALAFAQTKAYTGEDGDGATITITNAAKGETYSVVKLFDATVTGTADGSIAYQGTIPEALSTYFTKNEATGEITATAAAKKDNGELTDAARDALKTWAEGQTATSSETSDGSALEFTNLPYGYYVVLTTQGATATVDSTNPNATVVDKNTTQPTIQKKVKDDEGNWVEVTDANINEAVEFKLDIQTTNWYTPQGATEQKQVKEYVIGDDFANGKLDLVSIDSVQVITVNDDTETVVATVDPTPTAFPMTVSWVNGNTSLYPNGAVLRIVYKAKLKDDALVDVGDQNPDLRGNVNTGDLNWTYTDNTPHFGEGEDHLTDTASVDTYAMAFKKFDIQGNAKSGAEFTLPFYVKSTVDSNGNYVYAGTTAGEGLTNVVTSPANGQITIVGVKSADYSITETKAPDGYNKLAEPFTVTPVKISTTTTVTSTTKTWKIDEDGNVTDLQEDETATTTTTYTNNTVAATVAPVLNLTGTELPSTGGMGTTILYVAGGIMVLLAGVYLITKRRASKEEEL